MSNYSNFVGYVPDKLRLVTSGGGLVEGSLGLPVEFIAGLAFGPVSTGNPVSGPGLGLLSSATFVVQSGCSYIDFENIIGANDNILVTGEAGASGTLFEARFSNLQSAGNITSRSERLQKFSLPALNSAGVITYVPGNNVTGEIFSPNLKSSINIVIGYGSGGLINLNNTFGSLVTGEVSISGYPGFQSGNTQLLPYSDFLTGIKQGHVTFHAGSNWENIAIAQNYTGIVNTTNNVTYLTHQNTTGVIVPSIQNSNRTVSITGSATATGNLTVTLAGPEAITGTVRNISISQLAPGKALTVINNSDANAYQSSANSLSLLSSGSVTFSGNNWQGLTQVINSPSPGANLITIISGNNNVIFTTTGNTFDIRNTLAPGTVWARYRSSSGNITFNLINAQTVHGGFAFNLDGSGTTGVYSFPEAVSGATLQAAFTSAPVIDLRLVPLSANAVNTVQILNIPKLHSIPRDIFVQTLSGSTFTLSGADLTFISGVLSIAPSGNAFFTFTGGPGSGSGFIRSGVLLTGFLPGTTISGNLGSLASIGGLTINHVSGGTVSLTATGLQTISGNFTLNTSGNILFTGGTQTIVQSGLFITGVSNTTINIRSSLVPGTTVVLDSTSGDISITGGHTGSATGVLTGNFAVTGRTSSANITGILNGIQTISGNLSVISSGNTNVELTGLAQVSGLVDIRSLAASTFKHPLENATSLTGVGIIATGTTERTLINITGNSITGITAPSLARVGNISGEYSYTSGFIISTGIRNINLPSLTGWHGKLRIETPNITGFNMSGIRYIGATGSFATLNNVNSLSGFTFIAGTGLTGELNFGNLEQLHIYSARTLSTFPGSDTPNTNVFFVAGSGLTSINMSGLVTGIYKVANSGNSGETYNTTFQCTGVTGMRFGTSGTTKLLQMNFIASGCPLNQASVDQILQTFASLDGTNSTAVYSGRTITLNGLCAAPSAAGSGFRATLTGAGRLCTVLTNV